MVTGQKEQLTGLSRLNNTKKFIENFDKIEAEEKATQSKLNDEVDTTNQLASETSLETANSTEKANEDNKI